MSSLFVLLGSGVSRPSGLPGVRELTDAVLTAPLVFIGGSCQFCDRTPDFKPMFGSEDVAGLTQCFLRFLKSYADRYYAVRTGWEANYEDIYFLARQIADDQLGEVDNPAIDGFIREVREQADPLIKGFDFFPRDRYANAARNACRLIEFVVATRLKTPALIKGYDLISELAADVTLTQLDIVTLNHDLITETFLRDKGHKVVDGFGPALGDICRFEPTLFDGKARIRLLKLHGSINWHHYRNEKQEDFYAIPKTSDAQHAKDASGKPVGWFAGPLFLAGTVNKMIDYGTGIFAEQFFRFRQITSQHDAVLVSGYGFNDKGINTRLWEWLHEKSSRSIIILHENPDELFARARSSLSVNYNALKDTQRLTFVEKWMQNATWRDDVQPRFGW